MLQSVWFPALLKSPEGEVLAEGSANVVPETGDVNFKSEFVPLYPMNTVLVVTRLEQRNKEVAKFTGKVYLSSRNLMRLVSVEREILDESNHVFRGLKFNATLTAPQEKEPPKKGLFRLFAGAPKEEEAVYEVEVAGLGRNVLEFLYDAATPFYPGQQLSIKVDLPIDFPETALEIEEAVIFGEKASYRCSLPELPDELREELVRFLKLNDPT